MTQRQDDDEERISNVASLLKGQSGGGTTSSVVRVATQQDDDDGVSKPSGDTEVLFLSPSKLEEEAAIVAAENGDGAASPESAMVVNNNTDEDMETTIKAVCTLSEDIYSLIYIVPTFSSTMLYSAAVAIFQITIMCLMVYEQIASDQNSLQIPPQVNVEVAVSQALCMVLIVAVAHDVVIVVITLQAGHSDALTQDLPSATLCKFLLANALQLLIGLLNMLAKFLLVMHSSTVLDVFLKLAAMGFVATIDDVGFSLAKKGFVTNAAQEWCAKSQTVQQPMTNNRWVRKAVILGLLACLMSGFAVIRVQQNRGIYLCPRILVQFGDAFRHEYGGFSGEYVMQLEGGFGDRVHYLEANSMGSHGKTYFSMLAYCDELESWTHTYWDTSLGESPDPCQRWGAKSGGKIYTYDITDTRLSTWVVQSDSTNTILPLSEFYMTCLTCNEETCNPEFGTCRQDGQCVCKEGHYGLNCVFEDPCETIKVNKRFPPFPIQETSGVGANFADDYDLLRDVANDNAPVYVTKHPVYYHRYGNSNWNFLLFTGRRWIITYNEVQAKDETDLTSIQAVVDFFNTEFHAVFTDYSYSFASEPMDYSSPSYQGTPVGINWIEAETAGIINGTFTKEDIEWGRSPVGTRLLCAICHETKNPCRNQNKCNTGECECRPGYFGDLCEAAESCTTDQAEAATSCQHNGTCQANGICKCSERHSSARYYGPFCEFDFWEGVLDYYTPNWQHNSTATCGCASTNMVEYRGDIAVTSNGNDCQPWDSQEPNPHPETSENFPEFDIAGNNHCRNVEPSVDTMPGCYTTTPSVVYEYCTVPICPAEICPETPDICGCQSTRQTEYRGTMNVTANGEPCLRWDRQLQFDQESFVQAGLEANYCRNPRARGEFKSAWCYTADGGPQVCNVPVCPFNLCPGFDDDEE